MFQRIKYNRSRSLRKIKRITKNNLSLMSAKSRPPLDVIRAVKEKAEAIII